MAGYWCSQYTESTQHSLWSTDYLVNPGPIVSSATFSVIYHCWAGFYCFTNTNRFNSAIIPTIGTNNYGHITVDPAFLDGGFWNSTATTDLIKNQTAPSIPWHLAYQMLGMWSASPYDLDTWINQMQDNAHNTSLFKRVEAEPCLLQYVDLFGNRSDVIFVTTTNSTMNNSLFAYGMSGSEDPWATGWFLGLGNSFDSTHLDIGNFPGGETERAQKISNWTIVGHKIDYCLSSQISTDNLCTVEYSSTIMTSECSNSSLVLKLKLF